MLNITDGSCHDHLLYKEWIKLREELKRSNSQEMVYYGKNKIQNAM